MIVKEALANGRLSPRGADDRLAAVAREAGAGADAVALAAVLARPWVDVVLSGAASAATLASNLEAARIGWSDDLGRRLARCARAEDYSAQRSRLPWSRRRPRPQLVAAHPSPWS